LIARALVDPDENGLLRYQNKCCVEIFSRGKRGISKALLNFGIENEKPVIIFYKEDST
jgi:hypothetical protein